MWPRPRGKKWPSHSFIHSLIQGGSTEGLSAGHVWEPRGQSQQPPALCPLPSCPPPGAPPCGGSSSES